MVSQYFFLTLLIFYSNTNFYVAGKNWVGDYKWTSQCSQNECCCFVNQLKIAELKDNPKKLSIVTTRNGANCLTTKYENIIDIPEKSFMDPTKPRTLIWIINQNSTTIAAVDYQFTNCNSEAIRITNSATKNNIYIRYFIIMTNFIVLIKWFYVQE
ncbi:hypothetical protein I4U23_016821 [Adineta vaga]|nr:hypothetical protein I4U23_016821 [Adineta vaga]